MRSKLLAITFATFACGAAIFAGDDDARALVDKSIEASGGAKNVAKFDSAVYTEKGTYYGMGQGVPYVGVTTMQYPDKFKMEIVDVLTMCLNGDKGWTSANGEVKDMPQQEVDVQIHNNRAGWMSSLLPLRDKAFALKSLPDAKIDGKDVRVLEASRKEYPNVKFFFDTKSSLLVRVEFKTKAMEQGEADVTMEHDFSDFKEIAGVKIPHKSTIRRDGKLFVESEVESATPEPKLDPKTFAKPS